MESTAVYPPELAKKAFEQFQNLTETNRPFELPPESTIGLMLEVCFLTSLLREESRQIELRLGYSSPTRLAALANPGRGIHWVPFASPRVCSAAELRRLAPALDSERSIICCYGSNELKLFGIFTAESDHSNFLTRSVLHGKMMPNLFNVRSASPGELAIACGDDVQLQLFKGRVRFPTTLRWDGPILNHLMPINSQMESDAWLAIEGLERPSVGWTMTPYFPFILKLLHTLDRRKHGGSLLLIPDAKAQQLNDEIIRIKYRLHGVSGWQMCTEWVSRLIKNSHLSSEPTNCHNSAMHTQPSLDEAYQSIMRFSEFVGNLGCVDGTVLITEKLEVLGFGAEISALREIEWENE